MIREGRNKVDGEDDKIYYFFTEVSVEYEFFGKLLIPRVARVCKVMTYQLHMLHDPFLAFPLHVVFDCLVCILLSLAYFMTKPLCMTVQGDQGGQRTLQKKWTSFLKAKLVCSMPELNFVFNVVHDVFILKAVDWKDTVIYGVFTSQWLVLYVPNLYLGESNIMCAACTLSTNVIICISSFNL